MHFRILAASVDKMSSSRLVNHPDLDGKVVTSAWIGGGNISAGMTHSFGMAAVRLCCFAIAMDSQFSLFDCIVASNSRDRPLGPKKEREVNS